MNDYLVTLFGHLTDADFAADAVAHEAACAAEALRVIAVKAALAAPSLRPACSRCGGSGRMPMFAHVAGGVCFACNGDGFVIR